MARPLLLLALLVACVACDRNESKPSAVDASSPPVTSSSSSPLVVPAPAPSEATHAGPPATPVEAQRKRVTRVEDDPALVAAVDALKKHYGGQVPKELWLQAAERPEGRGRALVVGDATKPPPGEPFAIVVDGSGAVKWTKERPAAGIMAPIGPLAIAAGPSGRIALAVCDPPTTRVALRIWDDDGSPFADYDAMDIDDCTAMSLLYWPRRGFVIAATRAGTTKLQLVSENGALSWRRGIEIGARSPTGAAASLAADSDESFVLVQYGSLSAEPGARPHALAFRYDRHGAPLWPSPADLGVQPVDRPEGDRIVVTRPKVGVVRATLAKNNAVDVTSNGTVTPVH
jgi:hypothetical protein